MSSVIKHNRFFFFLTGIFIVAVSCNSGTTTSEEVSDVITPVTIVPVAFESVTSSFDLPAVSIFMNKSIIRATATGIIENISINQGDFISAGRQLFTIRTRESMALGNIAGNDSSLAFKGLINIISHNDGVISSLNYRKGDFVQEGDELAVVSEQNSLVFILEVPFELEKYVENNRNCTIDLPGNNQIKGNITGKLSEMDLQSQTVRYVVKTLTTEHLPGGLIASVKMVRSKNDKALVLPKQAVLGDETQTEFWVMKLINDSTAVKVIVSKGFENNEKVEITKPAFLVSDRVILTGNYGLSDTAGISIIKE
jgi:multidrug efflux pump subunit AcrA (membrane-fusion protein)